MADRSQRDDATPNRLWEAIETRRVGMLSLTKSGLHGQPMIAFVERRRKRLWFIARTDSDLARAIGDGAACMFVLQEADLLVSVSGELSVVQDRPRMARYWDSRLAAWLPEGLDDPALAMLRMDCVDAELWVADLGLTKVAWEIAWTGKRPQVLESDGRTPTFH